MQGRTIPDPGAFRGRIGVILAPWDSEYNMDVYLNQADEAMYEEKKMYHEKYGDRRRR